MCGRARCTLRHDDLPRACHQDGRPLRSVNMDRYRPSYNVSPGRDLPVIRREDGGCGDGVVLHCMKWGLIPSFTKKTEKPDHYKMFNARSESIFEKASFRRLVPNNRCLLAVEGSLNQKSVLYYLTLKFLSGKEIIVDGCSKFGVRDKECMKSRRLHIQIFYEWKKDGSKKQPYYIHFKDGRPLVFAALYDSWKNSEGEVLYTFTIVTTSSSSALQWLHDRMPVILGDKASTDAWLIGSSSSKFETVLRPYEEQDLAWYPVTPAMGKPSFDGPECIKEIKVKSAESKPISKFFLKKEANIEQESSSQVASVHGEPSKTHQPNRLKEEPVHEDSLHDPSLDDKGNDESKPNLSTISHEEAAKLPNKRMHEEFSADTKPFSDKADRPPKSPFRKKGNLGTGDKQPTLFSYFGKK